MRQEEKVFRSLPEEVVGGRQLCEPLFGESLFVSQHWKMQCPYIMSECDWATPAARLSPSEFSQGHIEETFCLLGKKCFQYDSKRGKKEVSPCAGCCGEWKWGRR